MIYRGTNGKNKVLAFSSNHSITLVFDWHKSELSNLLGFAVRKHNPDGTILWLEGMLPFRGHGHIPGSLIPSNLAPFQKMYWADYNIRSGDYTYDVIPVVRTSAANRSLAYRLEEAKAVSVTASSDPHGDVAHQVHFNRAVVSSQAYARNFNNESPINNPDALRWLARGLDRFLLDFLDDARKKGKYIDVAAYHMTHDDIISAICAFGDRARVSLCWKKDDDQTRNEHAENQLTGHGVEVHLREEVGAISHNKYVVVKDAAGNAEEVLMGSANFTHGGISLQNNVYHRIKDKKLAAHYLDTFELLITEDNVELRKRNKKWYKGTSSAEVNFSPHSASDRSDLDTYTDLVTNAASSVFYATFRSTDFALIDAMVNPQTASVFTRGLVDATYQTTEGDTILYHAAREKDPAVVPAFSVRSNNFMVAEREREGFNPLVHHKFIVIDADTADPIIITGSANYSKNSSQKNDENTLIIRDNRIGKLYLSEFFRIYEHYRSRWYLMRSQPSDDIFLREDNSWSDKYYNRSTSKQFFDK
ncbi:MAG: hypothetical protein JNM00_02525, partial [Flavobacteriales bacterium]|nr:hypothetical protein [Flavobacteriales bacterium]